MAEKLERIFEGMEIGLGRTIRACTNLSLWTDVVDQRVSSKTEAIKIRNKVLYVNTETSTWAQELTFLKKELIEKFNRLAGEEALSDIRFKVAHIEN